MKKRKEEKIILDGTRREERRKKKEFIKDTIGVRKNRIILTKTLYKKK